MCVCIKSKLEPRKILKAINLIEKSLGGNERNYKANDQYGDRTIDIDVLFYGNKIITDYAEYNNREKFIILKGNIQALDSKGNNLSAELSLFPVYLVRNFSIRLPKYIA